MSSARNTCGLSPRTTATATDLTRCRTATGVGPIDATYHAIDSIVEEDIKLLEYTVQAITEGMDAIGKVTARIQVAIPVNGGDETVLRQFMGRGADTDVITASAKAYLACVNRVAAKLQPAPASEPPA